FFQRSGLLLFYVQPAFGFIESRPSPRARIFARLHGPRAIGAPNARIILVVQRVVWHLVLADVIPNLLRSPVGQRIEFYQAELRVPLEFFRIRAGGGLVAANSRHPG